MEISAVIASVNADCEADTKILANDLAAVLGTGDVVALAGELGAGKSTFCRWVIRSLAADDLLEVPSPTFTLVQPYETNRFSLAHFDLYRLGDSTELVELGFDDYVAESVMLIEWPEKGGDLIPSEALWIKIEIGPGESARKFSFRGDAAKWRHRLIRTLRIREFLNGNGCQGANRSFLQGDASTRQYETITHADCRFVLMNDGNQTDASPRTSNSIGAFVAIDKLLAGAGIRVPKIQAMDLECGLLLLEHLGNEPVLANGLPIAARYLAAVELLAHIHELDWPSEVKMEQAEPYRIPIFDLDAMLTDLAVFLDWYVAGEIKQSVSPSQRETFLQCWSDLFAHIRGAEKSLVLRDFHSPNLIWQSGESGIKRIGVVDFQDALIGPSAYDLASVTQDARTTVSHDLQTKLLLHYLQCRSELGTDLDRAKVEREIAILGAYRASRILGVFVRLSKRDGKPNYMQHIPGILKYLQQNLKHSSMAELEHFIGQQGWI